MNKYLLDNYALFGGGGTNTSSEYAVPVDVYTIA